MVLGAETWSCFSVQGIVTGVVVAEPMAQDSQGLPGLRNNLPKYFNVETLVRIFFFRFTIDWIFANFFLFSSKKWKLSSDRNVTFFSRLASVLFDFSNEKVLMKLYFPKVFFTILNYAVPRSSSSVLSYEWRYEANVIKSEQGYTASCEVKLNS